MPSDEEIERVKAGLFLDFGLFPYFLLHTGMRRGELLALRWEDIDREHKLITVNKAVYFAGNTPQIKAPKTDSGRREIVLLDALAAVLPKDGKGYVFGGEKPLTKCQVRKRWEKWCREAGLATKDGRAMVTPHQLRHAFATILFDAGIDAKVAQELLGHSSIQVTRDIYTHIRKSRMESTAETLNNYQQQLYARGLIDEYALLEPYLHGPRCTFPDWSCEAPCAFGPQEALTRSI